MKAYLIFNPAAGQRDLRVELQNAIDYLEGRGWRITTHETRARGDATTCAREAVAAGSDVALVAGGDGTVNEAVNGLAGSDVALAVLPHGTGNVWAAEIGLVPIPTPLHKPDLLAAARALADGQIRTIDLGRAGDHYFLLWTGIGIDAEITARVEVEQKAVKRRLGALTYVVSALPIAWSWVGTRATITIDGREVQGRVLLVLVSNAQLYAGMLRVAANARLDDGLLDVCIFRGHGLLRTVRHLISVLVGQHLRDPEVEYHRARHVTIGAADPLRVQADGDPLGITPIEITVVPCALKVLVPRTVSAELFVSP